MPRTITLTIRIVNDELKVVDQDGKEDEFQTDPGDTVIWRADAPVGQWSVGFPDANKVPFTGNRRHFSGSTHTSDTGKTRHAPDNYAFWVFAERTDVARQALFLDPKLIIRSGVGTLTQEWVSGQAAIMARTADELWQAAEVADAAYLELVALERRLEGMTPTSA